MSDHLAVLESVEATLGCLDNPAYHATFPRFELKEREALRAAIALMRGQSWQSIETAPKDGTAVLVMRNNWPGCAGGVAESCNGHNTYVAGFWGGEGEAGEWVCYMGAVLDPQCPVTPTHWQPLPAPPKEPAE